MRISMAFELTGNTCALLLVGVGFTFGMVGPLPPPPPPLNPPLVGHVQQSVRTRYLEVVWPKSYDCKHTAAERGAWVALSPGHSQILSCSCGGKTGEALGSLLRHGPEMVDSVST